MNAKKIIKQLEQLPKEWAVVFVVRVVTQCLPGLLYKVNPEDPHFACWNNKYRHRRLLNVFLITLVVDHIYIKKREILFKIQYCPLHIEYPYHGTSAAYAASLSEYFQTALFSAENAVNTFVSIAEIWQKLGIHISNEICFLKKHLNSGRTATDYFYHPLYAFQNQEWRERGKKFVQVLYSYGHGFDIWANWFKDRINGVPTDKQFFDAVANLPEEIIAQEPAQINAYLKNICQTERPLNRVRVIFLGYGEAGKTSLIRALNGLDVVAGKEQMTPGIDISTWQVPGTEIIAHFWDFGGQVVAHATHQFFLRSRCLYVLLLDGRTEINANEQAEYWLEHVRAFGSKAPVMLVGNKADLCAVNLDMARLKEKHSNVIGFYPLSCTQYQGEFADKFLCFKNDLIKEAGQLGVHQIRFGKAHLAVLDELTGRAGKESFLPKAAWLDLCAAKGLAEQGDLNQAWLLDLFDKLGVIVHFHKIHELDSYILNPRWLTYGVYTLLYSPKAKEQKGRLRKAEIVQILSAAKVEDNLGNVLSYPQDKAAIVIQAMEQFKLCFPCRHEQDMIVIPALLESDQPQHNFEKRGSLAFEFDFTGFLPRHIMPNFIVGRHTAIVGEFVWQNGVMLRKKDESAEALVQVDYHDRKLSLWVLGPKANDYFKLLYDDIKEILDLMPELRFEEFVIVPEESRIGEQPLSFRRQEQVVRANFRQLRAMEDKGRTEYDCEYGTFDLGKILQIMPRERHRQESGKTICNFYHTKGDVMVGETSKHDNSVSVYGSTIGGNVFSNPTIQNSFNTVTQSAAEPTLKAALEQLCQHVEQMLTQLPEEKKQEVVQDLDSFVKEATKEAPRRKWYELSAEGLIEAAKACAGMTAPVTSAVKSILDLLQPA